MLAIIPMIMVALGGALLVSERADEARASRAAERSMTEVAALDNLRDMLASELSSVALQDAAAAFNAHPRPGGRCVRLKPWRFPSAGS